MTWPLCPEVKHLNNPWMFVIRRNVNSKREKKFSCFIILRLPSTIFSFAMLLAMLQKFPA